MSGAPDVERGDWIRVGSIDCVITDVVAIDLTECNLEVVCGPDRPTLYHASWNGEAWEFEHPMRGTYAEQVPRVAEFVTIYNRGKR